MRVGFTEENTRRLGLGWVVAVAWSLSVNAVAADRRGTTPAFPQSPDPVLTPGSLCSRPVQKRYAEGIPYCARDVSSALKKEIMQRYDQVLGYQVTRMNRQAFKIDHFIPLCMGGSNEPNNLWPQHQSVYTITDDLEHEACSKMLQGKMTQADAVQMIREAKLNLSEASEVLKEIRSR